MQLPSLTTTILAVVGLSTAVIAQVCTPGMFYLSCFSRFSHPPPPLCGLLPVTLCLNITNSSIVGVRANNLKLYRSIRLRSSL